MTWRPFALGASLLIFAACGGDVADTAAAWPVKPAALELTTIDWNATHTELGTLAAITEDGDNVVVFGEHGATLFAGGAAAGSDNTVTHWQAAGRIPAADGGGQWPVGIDADGKLYRVRAGASLEGISDRYGLLADSVGRVAAMGTPYAAFAAQNSLIVADGQHVTRYDMPTTRSLAGDAHRVASVATDGNVRVLDVDSGKLTTLALADAQNCGFLGGQLFIQTPNAIYLERDGQLDRIFDGHALHGLAVSAARVWFAQGNQLCAAENEQIACSSARDFAADSGLFGSASGDAWVLSDGELTRYGLPATGDEATWRMEAFSVYARVCSSCHAPGGTAGIDLSTYGAWQSKRDKIIQRVIQAKNMPPDRALSEQDRDSIARWAGSQ